MKKYLSSIYVSKNSTPSMVTIAELNYGRTKQHKLRSHWSDHFFLDLFQDSIKHRGLFCSVLFCSVRSNWRLNQMVLYIQPYRNSIMDHIWKRVNLFYFLCFSTFQLSYYIYFVFIFTFFFFLDLLVYWGTLHTTHPLSSCL
jgi:hypothetical protein